jgi:hypothetical protein
METYKLNKNIIEEVTLERLTKLKDSIGRENNFNTQALRLFMLPPTLNAFKTEAKHFENAMML